MKKNQSIRNLKKVEKTVKIPVLSNLRMVNGRLIALVNDVIETPIEWLKEDKNNGKGAC
ncbi:MULTISPECIES: hypothetical protein [Bacillaceae]|uniref:hypothetical protein n=1 Tax=Anoxybacillaceae TaxID=3120669 RepID=UPI000AE4074B|nr:MULTISPECIES: hypothetical protein [Bacillaceae]GCD83712.1 hypothetical protein PTHTG4_27760 [Parageobacillus thermoglucosidasius]